MHWDKPWLKLSAKNITLKLHLSEFSILYFYHRPVFEKFSLRWNMTLNVSRCFEEEVTRRKFLQHV